MEAYGNNYSTTLSAAIDASTTTVTVNSAPTGDLAVAGNQWRLQVGTELMLVTSVSGTTLTVTRGIEGTTQATHSSGDAAIGVMTKASLLALRSDGISSGASASRPSAQASGAGRLYLPTDEPVIFVDNGSAWISFGPIYKFIPPVDSDFSWHNQGGSTTVQQNGSILLNVGSSSGGNLRGRIRNTPTPPYDIKMAFTPHITAMNNNGGGLWLIESGSGKIVSYQIVYSGGAYIWQAVKWNSASSFNDIYTLQNGANNWPLSPLLSPVIWLRLVDNNTDRKCYVSYDGLTWHLLLGVTRTDFITPDRVGFFYDQENTAFEGILRLLSWEQ